MKMSYFIFTCSFGVLFGFTFGIYPAIYFYSLLFLGGFLSVKKFTLIKFYLFTWGLLFVNYFFGLLSYDLAASIYPGFVYLILYTIPFILGYAFSNEIIFVCNRNKSEKTTNSNLIGYIGFISVICFMVGNIIDNQSSGIGIFEMAKIRDALNSSDHAVSVFTKFGAVFLSFSIITFALFLHSNVFNNKLITKITLISLLIVPALSAGRQIYLLLLIMGLVGLIARKSYSDPSLNFTDLLGEKKISFLRCMLVILLILIFLISILRFQVDGILNFESKLLQFSTISSASLSPGFKVLYDFLKYESIQGIFVEGTFYFGVQLGKYFEIYGLNEFDLLNFDLLSKFPFFDRNFERLCLIFTGCSELKVTKQFVSGNIFDYSWATAISQNIVSYGLIGSLVLQFIFGFICSVSSRAIKCRPESFSAFNFFLANSVVIFYSIMHSAFYETYFTFYYILSVYLFLRNNTSYKFLPRNGQ
jgi:oligosaccharide repeat unit polymerase